MQHWVEDDETTSLNSAHAFFAYHYTFQVKTRFSNLDKNGQALHRRSIVLVQRRAHGFRFQIVQAGEHFKKEEF